MKQNKDTTGIKTLLKDLREERRSKASSPDSFVPDDMTEAGAEAETIRILERTLNEVRSGKVKHLIMVMAGDDYQTEVCCVRMDQAARMLGLLTVTHQRLTRSLAQHYDALRSR